MAPCQRALLLCDTLCNDQPAGLLMTDVRTSTTLQDQTSATSPVYAHTLSSEAVLDALKMILIGAPLNDVLASIALLIEAHTPGALCSVFLLDEDGVHLRYAAAPTLSDDYRIATDGVSIGPHVGSCGAAAYLGQPVFVSDVLSHPHFASFKDLIERTGMRASWSSPIISHNGKVLGTFGMFYREVREPGPAEIQLIDDASRIAGIAIERDRSKSALAVAFEKIKGSEAELRQIVDVIPQAIVVMTPEGKAIYANRATIEYTGLSMDEVRDDGFRSRVFHPEDLQRLHEQRRKALSRPVPFESELRILGKDGKYRWFVIRYNPLLDENGKVIRWYATATDIDDRKRAEDRMRNETVALREEIVRSSMFEEIVGSSGALRKVLEQVSKVAPTDSTVLIQGETGTGKELIARAIHNRSKRANRAFIRVNCGAIPPSLIASDLFGHEKGSFTGALQRRLGRFESADGGTIFLDEIGELPPETQIALLRVLQEREFERVGGNQPISIDVRVLTATNKDLNAAIAEGTFRQDLFYRLNVFPIHMPPLRERADDISLLVEYLIERYARRAAKRIRTIDRKTMKLLQAYDWPGNIRELQNVIERAIVLCEGDTFSVDEAWFKRESSAELPRQSMQEGRLGRLVRDREKEMTQAALASSGGGNSGSPCAAAKLGIPRQTRESKVTSLGFNRHRFKTG